MTIETTGSKLNQSRNIITAIPGPKSAELLARRNAAVSAGVSGMMPVFTAFAGDGVLVDVDGNSFIDMGAGIAVTNVGNSAPLVVAAVKAQVENFTHTCFMVTPYSGYVEVCELLNELTPGTHAKKSALFNSGAEALENAVKVARSYTKRQAVIVFEHGYHGRTNLTMAMTAKNLPYKHGFGPFASEIYRVPVADPFRDCRTGAEVAAEVIRKIEKEVGATNIAAIVIEPIQGEGGFIAPTKGFLPALVEYANANGIVFVADEVQTGFCRTGSWFGCDDEGIVPDLITTAKGIAGGLPLAAVTGKAEIMDSVHAGGLGGTYGGNPIACAAAIASIQTMRELDLISRAKRIEEIAFPILLALKEKYDVIGDVRGRGAMLALEFIQPGSLTPNPEITGALAKACHQAGVIILTAGTYGNVIRLLPPLTMPEHLLIEALDVIDTELAKLV
jgi:4-aminobutyrate aminotransferase/(S)-3-amino-2-methylpropionate transaminase